MQSSVLSSLECKKKCPFNSIFTYIYFSSTPNRENSTNKILPTNFFGGLLHPTLQSPMAYCMLFQPSSPFVRRCKPHSNPAVGSQHHRYRPKSSHSLPLHTSQFEKLRTKWQCWFLLVAKDLFKDFLVLPVKHTVTFLLGNCGWFGG